MYKLLERLDYLERQIGRVQIYSLLSAKTMLDVNDVHLLTGLSKAHIYRLTCDRAIPYYKPNGKQIYFKREDVDAWLQQNRVESETFSKAVTERRAKEVAQIKTVVDAVDLFVARLIASNPKTTDNFVDELKAARVFSDRKYYTRLKNKLQEITSKVIQ